MTNEGWVAAHEEFEHGLLRVRLDATHFVAVTTFRLPVDPQAEGADLILYDQRGAPPMLTWRDHGRMVIAEVELGGNHATTRATIPDADWAWPLAVTRIGDRIGLLARRDTRLVLYVIRTSANAAPVIEREPLSIYFDDRTPPPYLIAGLDNRPLITLQDRGRAMALTYTPDGPSTRGR